MRIIIAGSRSATEAQVEQALGSCRWIGFVSAIVSGGARGADEFGEAWARRAGVDVMLFVPDWKRLGKRAGPARNQEMAQHAEGLVAVWDGVSRGTRSMIDYARRAGLRIHCLRTDTNNVLESAPRGEVADFWELAYERASLMEVDGDMASADAERAAGKFASSLRWEMHERGDTKRRE